MASLKDPQKDAEEINPRQGTFTLSHEEACQFSKRGLFIGGCQKSGTTLLMSLLDNHPQLIVMPEETAYVERRWSFRKLKTYPAKLRALLEDSAISNLGTPEYAGFDHQRFVALAREFIDQPGMNDSLLFSETMRAYGIVAGADLRACVRWVEKTPKTETYPEELDELYPDAKVIQMVRDPRAVIASRKIWAIKEKGCTRAHGLAQEWNRCAREIPRLRRDPARFLVVRYEDLVKDSRQVLKEVCRFGGFEFSESMLEPTRGGNKWQGNSAFTKTFTGISATPADSWKTSLTENEIWWIELHCQKGMKLAGYPLQTDARFSLLRWLKRLPGESWFGYVKSRWFSLCQGLGLLRDCRYDA